MADNQPDDEVVDQEIVRRVTMLSESPATSIKAGELTKQSAGLMKNWRKRWFVLTSDFLAYLDRKDGVVKGGILLETATKVREASAAESGKHQSCFVVATADRDFVISAVSDDVRAAWISAISNATSAIKGGSAAPRLTSKPNAAVATEPTLESAPSIGKFTFNYFPVFGKGPAIAIALDIAELDWEGVFIKPGGTMETVMDDWSALKPSTPFGELPLLTTPDLGDIGHELAILNYIGKKTTLSGADDREFCISAQLMQMAEDIYQKLLKVQPNIFNAREDVVAAGTTEEFWTDSTLTNNNATQGCAAYLSYVEKFHASCNAGSDRYTSSGTTIGEIKLFVTLHMMVMVKQDCLDAFSAVKTFYDRFKALPAAKAVLETGSKFPRPFVQFFIAAKAPDPKGAVTATTTQTNPYTFKLTEVIAGGEPDAVFDFFAGSWIGPELDSKPSIWAAMRDAPDTGKGTFSMSEVATPSGAPEGRSREVLHSSGSKMIETLYSSDASTRVCKYALLGPLGFGTDSDFMTAMCGLKYDAMNLTFTVVPNPGGGSAVTWTVDANVTDPALADNMWNMFSGIFTAVFNGAFAA